MTETLTMTSPTTIRQPTDDWTAKEVADFLAAQPRTVHLIGIGGCGVSGLAKLLQANGHRVTGSDLEENPEVLRLRKLGITVRIGHSRENVGSPDLVSFTAAATEANPELIAVREAGIPCVRRARLLAALTNGHERTFAVAGIHGKTTTSAMLAHILRRADLQPSFCIGAHVPILGENAAVGDPSTSLKAGGKIFVAEADESDGSLTEYSPSDAIVLNIEPEHMDHFENLEELLTLFSNFASRASRHVFYCADDPLAAKVAQTSGLRGNDGQTRTSAPHSSTPEIISFGLGERADYRAANVKQETFSTSFDLIERGKNLGRVHLRIAGAQNASNAAAAAAAARSAGASFDQIAAALAEFTGAARRFERKLHNNDFLVIDDYAHHPTEIRATIEGVRGVGRKRVVVLFQPHRYSRTKLLRDQFATCFRGADRLLLTDIYAACEEPIAGVTGRTIFDAVKSSGQNNVTYHATLDELRNAALAEAHSGDAILVLGAGDITRISDELATRLRKNPLPHYDASRDHEDRAFGDLCEILSNKSVIIQNEPLSKHTTMRVGGMAQFWVEPDTEKDLSKLLRYCRQNRIPFYFIGRGSNLLVADRGVAGVVIRLNHPDFSKIDFSGETIRAGAGVNLRQLVVAAKRAGLAGLEFMEGIPGSLGGALRMNAGAMGSSTFDFVDSVRLMDFEGRIVERTPVELAPTYRSCEALKSYVALSATLRASKGVKADIDRRIEEFKQKRWASQPAAPSAGCIFKNTTTIPAGKLVDELGLKGLAVGGARISEIHGNFIINEGGATADDVLKLIAEIKETAKRERGVALETEVEIWENK